MSVTPATEKNRNFVARHYAAHRDEILKRKAEARAAKGVKLRESTADKFGIERPPTDPRLAEIDKFFLDKCTPPTAKIYSGHIKKLVRLCDSTEANDLLESTRGLSVGPATRKTCLQALLSYVGPHPEVEKDFQQACQEADEHAIQRSFDELVPSFNIIKEKIYEKFPEGSDQRLYVDLYDILPVRDDFGNISLTREYGSNWLDMKTREIHIGKHKTSDKYGPITAKLPAKFVAAIPSDREWLFDKKGGIPMGSMSKFVSDMLREAGVKDKGSINFLRHSYASTELLGSKVNDEAERRALFSRMMHSPMTQLKYLRKLK